MSKTFDCCMVFNELEMFELRLNILKSVVDYHIIVESGMTHSGQPKPRYFGDALEAGRFADFADRIIYVYEEQLIGAHSWDRERYHRGLISGVLRDLARPDDFVIVADCDEIPNPESVRYMQEARKHAAWEAGVLELSFFYYDFTHRVQQGWGIGMCLWREQQDANKIRIGDFGSAGAVHRQIPASGWHLSYFMTPEQVVTKLDAFMHHADVAKDVPRDAAWIADKMRKGTDLFGRTVEIVEVDPEPYLPQYVKEHREKYEVLGWLKPEVIHAP